MNLLATVAQRSAAETGGIAYDANGYADLMDRVRAFDARPGLPSDLSEPARDHLARDEGWTRDRERVGTFLEAVREVERARSDLEDMARTGSVPAEQLPAWDDWRRDVEEVLHEAGALKSRIPERQLTAHLGAAGASQDAVDKAEEGIAERIARDEAARAAAAEAERQAREQALLAAEQARAARKVEDERQKRDRLRVAEFLARAGDLPWKFLNLNMAKLQAMARGKQPSGGDGWLRDLREARDKAKALKADIPGPELAVHERAAGASPGAVDRRAEDIAKRIAEEVERGLAAEAKALGQEIPQRELSARLGAACAGPDTGEELEKKIRERIAEEERVRAAAERERQTGEQARIAAENARAESPTLDPAKLQAAGPEASAEHATRAPEPPDQSIQRVPTDPADQTPTEDIQRYGRFFDWLERNLEDARRLGQHPSATPERPDIIRTAVAIRLNLQLPESSYTFLNTLIAQDLKWRPERSLAPTTPPIDLEPTTTPVLQENQQAAPPIQPEQPQSSAGVGHDATPETPLDHTQQPVLTAEESLAALHTLADYVEFSTRLNRHKTDASREDLHPFEAPGWERLSAEAAELLDRTGLSDSARAMLTQTLADYTEWQARPPASRHAGIDHQPGAAPPPRSTQELYDDYRERSSNLLIEATSREEAMFDHPEWPELAREAARILARRDLAGNARYHLEETLDRYQTIAEREIADSKSLGLARHLPDLSPYAFDGRRTTTVSAKYVKRMGDHQSKAKKLGLHAFETPAGPSCCATAGTC